MIFLRKPQSQDQDEVMALYEASRAIHLPWTWPPENYENYLAQEGRYFVCLEGNGAIVGTFKISQIVRGHFHSAFLGYEVFFPHQGKGYMRKGLELLLREAFDHLHLHRLEANIQPGNYASIRLVSGAGFVKEGFSRDYLRVGGREWKDHERWAVLNPNWTEPES
jgi:ribosomal-protein-alanine N-acetyltransferase